jgi:hypothetical protein
MITSLTNIKGEPMDSPLIFVSLIRIMVATIAAHPEAILSR